MFVLLFVVATAKKQYRKLGARDACAYTLTNKPVACGHRHTTIRDPCTHTNYNIIKPVVSFLTFAQKTQYFHTKTEKRRFRMPIMVLCRLRSTEFTGIRKTSIN